MNALIRNLLLIITSSLLIACGNNTGNKMPNFKLPAIDGEVLSSDDLKGKITVVKIWATWCGPCIAEIPESNRLAKEYEMDKEVVFIAITDESREKVISFLKRQAFNYKHLTNASDLKNEFKNGLVHSIPHHIIIDKNQNIVFDETGDNGDLYQRIREKIEQLK